MSSPSTIPLPVGHTCPTSRWSQVCLLKRKGEGETGRGGERDRLVALSPSPRLRFSTLPIELITLISEARHRGRWDSLLISTVKGFAFLQFVSSVMANWTTTQCDCSWQTFVATLNDVATLMLR